MKNQNIVKYGISGEISTTILAFILNYFQEKLLKFLINFSKNPKKIIWGPFWALSARIWSKMNFRGKEGSANFKYFNSFPSCQKSEKTSESFLRKMLN